jgi:RNA polymerase sigma factor (sigma-70 family)
MARFKDITLDEWTVAQARRGETDALGRVYEACAPAVFTLIRRLVRQATVAEDLMQETFADVIRRIGTYQGRAPLPFWIRAIAVRRSLMYLRSPWHRSLEWLDDLPGPEPDTPDHSASVARARDLERALMKLPATARAVVWLHDVEGYTHEEIGAGLGRTTSYSKSQLSRAYGRLRRAIEGDACARQEEAPLCTPVSTS